jgi:tetratricopeptide (TPR) repeat protein
MRCFVFFRERTFLSGLLLVGLLVVAGCDARSQASADRGNGESASNSLDGDKALDANGAITEFSGTVGPEPKDAGKLLDRGLANLKAGRYEKAVSEINAAIKLGRAPDAEICEKLGDAYTGARLFGDAVDSYTKAVSLEKNRASAYYGRSVALAKMGEEDYSDADFVRARELPGPHQFDDSVAPTRKFVKEVQESRGKSSQTSEIASEIERAKLHYDQGVDKLTAGEYSEAINSFTSAIRYRVHFAEAYCRRAEGYAKLGLLDQAIRDYSRAVGYDCRSIEAYLGRAAVYERQGDFYLAASDYSRAIKIDSKQSGRLYAESGKAYMNAGDDSRAIEQFTHALENGENADVLRLRGQAYERLGDCKTAHDDFDAAVGLLEKAEPQPPELADAYRERAEASCREWQTMRPTGDDAPADVVAAESRRARDLLQSALADYNSIINMPRPDAKRYLDRAAVHEAMGAMNAAHADLDQAITLDPKNAEADCRKGNLYLLEGQRKLALERFEAAVKKDSACAEAFYGRGVIRLADHALLEAIDDFTTAIRKNIHFAAAYRGRGDAYLASRRLSQAIADYTDAIRCDDRYAVAYCQRAKCYYLDQQYFKALADCADAIRLQPSSAAYDLRGCTYLALDDADRAVADLREACDRSPRNARALNNLGVAYFAKKDWSSAIANFDDALVGDVNNTTRQHNLGLAYLRKAEATSAQPGQYMVGQAALTEKYNLRMAIDNLHAASERQPDDANRHYDLAVAYLLNGDYELATNEFGEAIRLDPGLANAYRYREEAVRLDAEKSSKAGGKSPAKSVQPTY